MVEISTPLIEPQFAFLQLIIKRFLPDSMKLRYFIEDVRDKSCLTKVMEDVNIVIRSAREYADIITVTLDGKSKHLKYVTYKDLTGEDPIYTENDQLVSEKYLKILSSWPGHTIY